MLWLVALPLGTLAGALRWVRASAPSRYVQGSPEGDYFVLFPFATGWLLLGGALWVALWLGPPAAAAVAWARARRRARSGSDRLYTALDSRPRPARRLGR